MVRLLFLLSAACFTQIIWAQQAADSLYTDTLQQKELNEVIIISQKPVKDQMAKPLSTLDRYLETAGSVNMIRRGSYAWEPFLNGMATERSTVTIDGMRIYGACTDKMDPITSYVEISNLSNAHIHSGPSGSGAGATIAGNINLSRKKGHFGEKQWNGNALMGYETNNSQRIAGIGLSQKANRFFTNLDFTYRKAGNYKAGGNNEILYSQFTKYNASAIAGYKINEHGHIEASLIFDQAVDVGYPALPMDVASARAWIVSAEYFHHFPSAAADQWQTKFYYNNVTHSRDDTKRPDVPVRMDMPGWSKTAGFYSMLQGCLQQHHHWKLNLSGHHNISLAEMTMFSSHPGESDMFMLTWPGVQTNYADIYLEDRITLTDNWSINLNAGLGLHNNRVVNEFGLSSLSIFYPDMPMSRSRLLKRIAVNLRYDKKHWSYKLELAYGERAPSISEGYGFYLFNSFDRFDYIGNPLLKKESSVNIAGTVTYTDDKLSVKLSGNWFNIHNYIIGVPQSGLSAMTIGANGVKIYSQLAYARIYNATFDLNYAISSSWLWNGHISYRRGIGEKGINLPLIQPFSYRSAIAYSYKSFSAEGMCEGAASQQHINKDFGEMELPAYVLFNLSVSQQIKLKEQKLTIKAGVENIADTYYTTFADWNRLPRMGRNFFINLLYSF